ncbi:MAG: hypothetical protein IJZ85_12000 [Lachnospiraceae bacterium]|nr:hypothetical protein [Lachnospiraceae bacterium]
MSLDQNMKMLIIGLGNLSGNMRPCYEGFLGENMKTNVIAIKATENRLEEKRREFGFEICVGSTLEVLKRQRPDVIFTSPPPREVPKTTEECLIPYYQLLREEGAEFPLLLNFAPDPSASYFYDMLGEDIFAVNILPNTRSHVEHIHCASVSYNYVTFDERHPWDNEKTDFLKRFLSPKGNYLECRKDEVFPMLSIKTVGTMCFDMCCQISDVLAERGEELSIKDIASCMRRIHRDRLEHPGENPYPCEIDDIPAEYVPFVRASILSFYDGHLDYARDAGIQPPTDTLSTHFKMDLQLLSAQLQSREKIEGSIPTRATKGGVLELTMKLYNDECRELYSDAFRTFLDTGVIDEDFFARWRSLSYHLVDRVVEHSKRLSK